MQGRSEDKIQSSHTLFGDKLDSDLAPLLAAAHELKTPLAVINYLSSMLRTSDSKMTSAERDQYLERIALSTARMSRLVEGFTLGYRLQNSNQANFFELEPVNIATTAEDIIHQLSPLAKQLDQSIKLHVSSRSTLAVANQQLLGSVLTNLCDNALKHSPKGSNVAVTLTQSGNWVRSSVSDNGAEVSRHDLLRLRGSLGKELQPLAGRSHSSGLGLYIVSQLARAMGGSLGSICHHKRGATFFVDLQRSYQTSLI